MGQRVAFDCNFEKSRPSTVLHAIPRLLWYNMKAHGRCGLVRLHWSIGWVAHHAKIDQPTLQLVRQGAFGGHLFSETEINVQNRLWNESLMAWWVQRFASDATRRFLVTYLFPLGILLLVVGITRHLQLPCYSCENHHKKYHSLKLKGGRTWTIWPRSCSNPIRININRFALPM